MSLHKLFKFANGQCYFSLTVWLCIILGITDDQTIGSDDDELPVLKRIEADLKSGSDMASPDGKQVDLFSEIHLNELKKLEKQLEQVGLFTNLNSIVLFFIKNIVFLSSWKRIFL